MKEYDVIVVGGGPAGASAAQRVAERGATVVLLEEHRVIGLPRHCSGRLQGSSFTRDIIKGMGKQAFIAECKARRFYTPSGKLLLETPIAPRSAWMLVRDEFDRELARRAALAGAEIVLNTRVSGLLKEGGVIRGVTTASRSLPEVRGRVVIAAQGYQGRSGGIAKQENMTIAGEEFGGGILLELQNVHDLEKGVLEVHFGAFTEAGFGRIWTRDDHSCFLSCPSLDWFTEVRSRDYLYSRKLRDARPIQVHGWAFGTRGGDQLPRLVKRGLLLVGDTAGYTSIVHAVVSGHYAAEVAVAALRDNDVSEGRLMEYQWRCEATGLHLTGLSWKKLLGLQGRSDASISRVLPGMVRRGEVEYADILPF